MAEVRLNRLSADRQDNVQMEAWMPPHPPAHGWMLVSGVMVQDQMQIESGRRLRIDLLEEPDECLVSMARQAGTDDRAIEQAQGREQGRRAVAFVVVGHRATAAFLHREARLGTISDVRRPTSDVRLAWLFSSTLRTRACPACR
jgi:hypothetical protein